MKSTILFTLLFATQVSVMAQRSHSFYQQRLDDKQAIYFSADKKTDVSDALQAAVNQVKTQYNFGVLFLPEGTYTISKTIYIPQGVRMIGYGAKRPLIVLARHSPGFQSADSTDKGQAKYMLWFVNGISDTGKPYDAGASTFYSALSNVDLEIGDDNPVAVALRTHYAQHSFIAHVDVHINKGKAGMFDVGNEMEDVRFYGGDYGIYTTKPSPGWQFMMTDTYFEGQRKAAIRTQEAGLTIVRMQVQHVPEVIEINPNYHEKLFMEDCQLSHISGPAITISNEENAFNQVSMRNVDCNDVPVLVAYRRSGKQVAAPGKIYKVNRFTDGLQMDDLDAAPDYKTDQDISLLKTMPAPVNTDIPGFPATASLVNLQTLGAKGDGETDDTKAIQDAIDKYPYIYVPQGWYKVSATIKLKPTTVLIGLNPIATQFILADNTPFFGGFGGPLPLLETSTGGNNIVSGIGLYTGTTNPRAVACKWMAGEHSFLNDVKFIGGHGSMGRRVPGQTGFARINNDDKAWDSQYWSLWITNGGGGIFKNIWTASTYATAGTYISNTSTPGRIYAMSIEHHVRNEVRFKNVSNWKVYAMQLEEESRESTECQPMELDHCHHMRFANLYMFRVIRVNKPYPYSIRDWSSDSIEMLNVHNYSQIKYTTDNPLYDINTNREVRPWEFARLWLSGKTTPAFNNSSQLAGGFEFAEGLCSDSKGNLYFCESRMRRIYKWSVSTHSLTLVADYPWEPLSLACDQQDHLLVVFKYVPKQGYMVNGKQEAFTNPPDAAGTSFSGWGNSGFAVWAYSIDPEHPDETIQLLKTVPMGSVSHVATALYPAHRWRDYHDFNTVTVNKAANCFVAPDGVTIIPDVYDLARSTALVAAHPGQDFYVTDEYDKRTVKLHTTPEGYPSDLTYFAERGEFTTATDSQGNIYIADGEVYVYSPAGKLIKTILTPERPVGITFSGSQLYMIGKKGLYSLEK